MVRRSRGCRSLLIACVLAPVLVGACRKPSAPAAPAAATQAPSSSKPAKKPAAIPADAEQALRAGLLPAEEFPNGPWEPSSELFTAEGFPRLYLHVEDRCDELIAGHKDLIGERTPYPLLAQAVVNGDDTLRVNLFHMGDGDEVDRWLDLVAGDDYRDCRNKDDDGKGTWKKAARPDVGDRAIRLDYTDPKTKRPESLWMIKVGPVLIAMTSKVSVDATTDIANALADRARSAG